VVDYTTYHFANGKWVRKSVEKIGFWESEDSWPQRSAFPEFGRTISRVWQRGRHQAH
jgi:hypothetical protein